MIQTFDWQLASLPKLKLWAEGVVAGSHHPACNIRGAGGWAIQSATGSIMDGFIRETAWSLHRISSDASYSRLIASGFRHDIDCDRKTPICMGAAETLLDDLSTLYPRRAQLRMLLPCRSSADLVERECGEGRYSVTLIIPLRVSSAFRLETANDSHTMLQDVPYLVDTSQPHRFDNSDNLLTALYFAVKLFDINGLTEMPCSADRWANELRLRDEFNERAKSAGAFE
jgi:hypothetical protein